MITTLKFDLQDMHKKIGIVLLGLVLAVAMAWPTPTRAQSSYTVAELQALLSQILAQLNALQPGGSASSVCPYTWTRALGQGSSGVDVMRLQQYLNASPDTRLALSGAGSPGLETQYYGPITAAAVSKFQVKYRAQVLAPLSLVNPTGYFGPSSMAQANRLCVGGSTTPPPSGGGPLEGGAGSVSSVRLVPGITNEDVGEGQRDVSVLGLELRAEGSDIELNAVVVDFDQVNHTGNFDRYADEVSIWLNGEEYATVSASDFTRSNSFRRTITLDRGAIIRQGNVGELVVAVSGARNLDSSRVNDRWDVSVNSIRFGDALGASISDSQMSDLSRTMTFREFSSSAGLRLTIRGGDTDVNQARVIQVSNNSRTSDVPVLSFRVDVEGSSDILVDRLSVNATTTGGTLNNIASAAYLYHEGRRIGSVNISGSGSTITFDNLNLDLDSGDVHDFEVRMDFLAANGTNYQSGATIDVDVLASNRDDWRLEDERGDNVSLSDRRGSASADAHTLQTEGAGLSFVSATTREVYNSSNPSASYGEFRAVVDVRAVGNTIYVPQTAVRSSSASTAGGLTYYFENSSGGEYAAGVGSQSFTRISGGSVQGGFVRIDEGQTARFELVATLNPEAFGQYRVQIVSVGWNDTASSPDSTMSATPSANFRTGLQVISD